MQRVGGGRVERYSGKKNKRSACVATDVLEWFSG